MFRFEERLEGKFEQECVEENCSSEELFEVFDDQDIYKVSWARYNQCKDVISKGLFQNWLPQVKDSDF